MYSTQLSRIGIDLKGKFSGQTKTLCPRCSQNRRNKNELCLSVNIDEGVWNCKNCGFTGSVKQKIYNIPEARPQVKAAPVYEWFEKRGISRETVDHFKPSHSSEFFSQDKKNHPAIGYNYLIDGKLVNIKFKTKDKMFRMIKDAQKVPFNIDSIKDHDYVIFVEGEEECMVWHQEGYPSVVSCPNGASDKNNNLEWLDAVYERFEGKKIYLATDNDGPGRKLKEDLSRRFDPEWVYFIDYPTKDANDTLLEGIDGIFDDLFKGATEMPIEELAKADEFFDIIWDYRQNGFPVGAKVGMKLTDEHLSWNRGELVVVHGIPGHGKSTWLSYQHVRLAAFEGWKFAVFSPEHNPALMITRICEQYLMKPLKEMTEAEIKYGMNFVLDHFYFYKVEKLTAFTVTHLLELAKTAIRKFGVDCVLFDPYTHIENDKQGDNNTERIGTMLVELDRFTKQHNVNITLVAHPRKMDRKAGGFEVPRMYDIAGSNNFFNTVDVGICVYRDYDTGISTMYVQKMKQHFRGKLGDVAYEFNVDSGTYAELGSQNQPINKVIQKQTLL